MRTRGKLRVQMEGCAQWGLLLLLFGLQLVASKYQQLNYYDASASSSSFGEPVFRLEPAPNVIEFSNFKGLSIPCLASGWPRPQVIWFAGSNCLEQSNLGGDLGSQQQSQDAPRPIGNLTGLRVILNGGQTLKLLPFAESDFRQEVHNTEYRCVAFNQLGAIHSRSVQVQATGK